MDETRTYFASPQRSSAGNLKLKVEEISKNPVMNALLTSVGGLLAILDENRQILSINDSFFLRLGIDDISGTLGLRLGEVLNCQFSHGTPNGCGTGKACSSCGAAIAIVSCLATHNTVERKCYLSCQNEEDFVFLVRAHPIVLDTGTFLALFLHDMTKEEQRTCLERTFFHDINNLMQGLLSASEIISSDNKDDELPDLINRSAKLLNYEIAVQRYLLEQDSLDFNIKKENHRMLSLLKDLESMVASNPLSKIRTMEFSCPDPEELVYTDKALFLRIAGNMVTNALEASEKEDSVLISFELKGSLQIFSVHNTLPIPDYIAMRIFQRNFSTKDGTGRGLGTFSMKLLGEKVLGGKVTFTSSPEEGTVFSFSF